MAGLYEMLDMAIADILGVDVETYIDIIDRKCTQEECDFIIIAALEENDKHIHLAKELFNKYLNE